jgi:hypothetical protein
MKPNSRSIQSIVNETPASGFSRKHILVIALLVIGLILAALGGFAAQDRRKTTAETAATPSRPERHRDAVDFRPGQSIHWQWPDSGATTYQIRQTIHLAPGDSELAPETVGLTVIEGNLHVGLASADASSVTLAMQFADASFTVDPTGDEPPRREPLIEKMLNSNAGLLQLGRDGSVISCRLPAALADGDRVMLEGLLSVQFVLGEGSRWESVEENQGFRFLSSYQTSGKQAVLKSRQVQPVAADRPTLRIVTSRTTATPGPFWIESLEGAERLEYLMKDKVVCTAETTTTMRRTAPAEMPEGLVALMRDPAKRESLIARTALTSADEAARASAIERQRIARLVETYQSVPASRMIEDIVKAVTEAKDHEETIPAMHALRDWLVANPDRSGEIAASLATAGFSDEVTARIAHALELAGKSTPEAQTALASVIGSAPGAYPPAAILQATVAAGGVGRVLSPELMPALSNLAAADSQIGDYQIGNAALYALGALARENPDLQQSLVSALSQSLDASGGTTAEDTATALRALANAANEDPVVMGKAISLGKSHEDEDVRMAAIDLLSTSRQAKALEAIRRSLANDPSETVRRHAISSLTRPEIMSADSIRPVLDFLGKRGNPETVRDFAIANLAPFHADFPEIRQAFSNQLPNVSGETADIIRKALSETH